MWKTKCSAHLSHVRISFIPFSKIHMCTCMYTYTNLKYTWMNICRYFSLCSSWCLCFFVQYDHDTFDNAGVSLYTETCFRLSLLHCTYLTTELLQTLARITFGNKVLKSMAAFGQFCIRNNCLHCSETAHACMRIWMSVCVHTCACIQYVFHFLPYFQSKFLQGFVPCKNGWHSILQRRITFGQL